MSAPGDREHPSQAFEPPSSSGPALKTHAMSPHARPEGPVREKRITGRQEVAISNLLIFPTIVKAAEATHINERTLRRWLA